MTSIISVVSGNAVLDTQQFSSAKSGQVARISAVHGARYVLAETQGGIAAANVSVKRVGKNLILEQDSEGAEPARLIIDDFFGSEGQLVGLGTEGEHLQYLAATELGAVDAAGMSDGASSLLTLAVAQPAAAAVGFQFNEGGSSVLSSALAGLAAVGGGFALKNGNGNGGGAGQPAPAASAFVLEDQVGNVVAGQPAPASVEPDVAVVAQEPVSAEDVKNEAATSGGGVGDAFNDLTSSASNIEAVAAESEADADAEKYNVGGSDGALSAVAPLGLGDTPVIEKMMDDHGIIRGVIENGGYTDDGYPTIMGKADPGVKVHVYRGKFLQGYAVADANGEWSFTPATPFVTGTHSITIIHEYADKEISAQSEPYVITVDKIAPGIPVITGIVDDEGRITGAITDQTITDDNRPTISGTAEANVKLIIYDKGKEIGSTTVHADGTWSFTPETPLADGLHMLSYSAMDRAGNSSQQTDVTEFVVDTRPEKINIYLADDNEGDIQGEMFNGSVTDDNTPTLIGAATAGGLVSIYEGDVLLGRVTADVDGTWRFTPATSLSEGAHMFHATVTLVAKGESERSKAFKLTVSVAPPDMPIIESINDNVGDVRGIVLSGGGTDDTTPTLAGRAEPNGTVYIYVKGDELLGTAQVDGSGEWSFTPAVALTSDTYEFTVKVENKVGKVSAASEPYVVTIDIVPPSRPSIDGTIDNEGDVTGLVVNGGSTDDTTPTLYGKAEPNSAVYIYINETTLLGSAIVNGNGDWSFTSPMPLADDTYAFTVTNKDNVGNVSVPSEPYVIAIDTIDPGKPTFALFNDELPDLPQINNGQTTFDNTPLVVGQSEANAVIVIYDKGVEIGRTTSDGAGNWRFTPATPLSDGAHNFSASTIDAAGNAGEVGKAIAFVVDSRVSFMEDWEDEPNSTVNAGGTLVSNSGLTIKAVSGGMSKTYYTTGAGHCVFMKSGGTYVLNFNQAVYSMYFEIRNHDVAWRKAEMLDADGRVVDTMNIPAQYDWANVNYVARPGQSFVSVRITSARENTEAGGDNGWGLDNVKWSIKPPAAVGLAFSEEYAHSQDLLVEVAADSDSVGNKGSAETLGSRSWELEGGDGGDVLVLKGEHQLVDIQSILEVGIVAPIIDITGTGDTTLKLSIADVLQVGTENLFLDDGNIQLVIKGDSGDRVELSDLLDAQGAAPGDWSAQGQIESDGVTYEVYQYSGVAAELLVELGVSVNFSNHF